MDIGDFRGYMPFESNIDEFNVETFDCGSPEEYADLACFTKKMAEIQVDDIWNREVDEQAWTKAPDPAELPCNPFSVLSCPDSRDIEHYVGLNPFGSNGLWNATSDDDGSDSQQHVPVAARPVLPPTPSLSIAKTVTELEQELVEQQASTSIPFAGKVPVVKSPAMPCLTSPGECAPFVPYWYDYLIGRIQFLPQEVPAVPQSIMDRYRQDAHMCLSWLCSVGNVIVPVNQDRTPEGTEKEDDVDQMVTSRRGAVYANKAPGMPSGKTIEDLAFGQFAGFMSFKERQWLIRIQMLQCQGTGDSSVDDYYYVNWKRKQLKKNGTQFDEPLMVCDTCFTYSSLLFRAVSSEYYPMIRRPRLGEYKKNHKTSTNLGRPYQCTSKFPRHLINVDDMEEKTSKKMYPVSI